MVYHGILDDYKLQSLITLKKKTPNQNKKNCKLVTERKHINHRDDLTFDILKHLYVNGWEFGFYKIFTVVHCKTNILISN